MYQSTHFYTFTSVIRGVSLRAAHVENGHPLEGPGALHAFPEGARYCLRSRASTNGARPEIY